MANPGKGAMERQLRRQSTWLRECLRWIMREKVLSGAGRPKALDVGCGPGFVTESLADLIDVSGVDTDEDRVNSCRARGFIAEEGSAYELPFKDETFDIVYCTFLVFWLPFKFRRNLAG